MKQGIGYLPEDRKGDGIIADLSVRDNIILALQVMKGFFRPFSMKQAQAFADEYIEETEYQNPDRRHPNQVSVRRQPAEGYSGPLAAYTP